MTPPERGTARTNKQTTQQANKNSVFCHAAGSALKAYTDGELGTPRRIFVEWHLRGCASCRAEFGWLKQAGEHLHNLHAAMPRPELRARILACLPDTPPVRHSPGVRLSPAAFSLRGPGLAFGSLSALLVFVAGAFALTRFEQGRAPVNRAALPKNVIIAQAAQGQEPNGKSRSNAQIAVEVSRPDPFRSPSAEQRGFVEKAPDTQPYTDPTSAAADRAVAAWMTKAEREQAQQEREKQVALLKTQAEQKRLREIAARTLAAAGTPRLTLAVADVAQARRELQQWTQQAGGTLAVSDVASDAAPQLRTAYTAAPAATGALLPGAQPVVPTNAFDSRWSGTR